MTHVNDVNDWLEQCRASGRLAGVEIEYLDGRRRATAHYRSDQLRLLPGHEQDVVEFARPKWHPKFEPHLTEKFQMPAAPADVRAVARLLLEAGVFTTSYPEEVQPGGADMLSTEIIVSRAGREYKRVYYRTVPEAVKPVTIIVERLVNLVMGEGQRTLLHQGKPVVVEDVPE